MFSARDRSQEPANDSFTRKLSELKRQGVSVLVVGSVNSDHLRETSRRLLGHATERPRRRVFVSTAGASRDRILVSDATPAAELRVVQYETETRSAVSQTPTQNSHTSPAVDDDELTASGLADLGIAISSAIHSFETNADAFEPGELRVGTDSLLPLLDDYSIEQVFKFVHLTNGRVTDFDGMVHHQLPVERDADVVNVLAPLFDVLVELREQNGTLQERWSLSDSGHCSGWLSLSE